MLGWKAASSPDRQTPASRRLATLVLVLTANLVAGYGHVGVGGNSAVAAQTTTAANKSLAGMGTLSGTVEATKPFKAAQVYIHNVDKRIVYMVYTQAGRFRAVALFPGNYEINVRAKGLESDGQKLVLKAGDQPSVKLTLRDSGEAGPIRAALDSEGGGARMTRPLTFESYDEVYPPGPGKEVAEQVCIICHGESFLPATPASEAEWNRRIDYMMGKGLWERDKVWLAEGVLAPPTSMFRFGHQDRKDLVAYLVKNFGPEAKPRGVRTDREMPLDEAQLGKAMFIEYYLPKDPPGQLSNAPEYKSSRRAFTVGFDRDGNVWLVDPGLPNRLVKLDPRTGVHKDYLLPDPTNGAHEILMDPNGMIWLPEFDFNGASGSTTPTKPKRLLGFDPKTEHWEVQREMDPDNVIRSSIKGMHSTAVDSKGNLYADWMVNGALSRWDRATTNKVTVFRIPVPTAVPYGMAIDRNDNLWIGLWSGNGIAKFDTTTNQFTMFTPPTYPAQIRRPNVDSKNNVWFGIFAAGKRPGKLVKLDQTTGRMTEWSIPYQNSQPYDCNEDPDGNIWFPDRTTPGRGSALGRFNPRTETFTFYPSPQAAVTTPKTQITRDGAVWYAPRFSPVGAGFGVLYPDMDKITTLGAFWEYGPPGYRFKGGSQ